MSLQIKRCRDCGTEIVWLNHQVSAKPAPIEAWPDRTGRGNVIVDLDRETYTVVPPGAKAYGRPIHANHLQLCSARQERPA